MGVKVNFGPPSVSSWSQMLSKAASEDLDAIFSMPPYIVSDKLLLSKRPLTRAPYAIVYLNNRGLNINTLEDLPELRGAVSQFGGAQETVVLRQINERGLKVEPSCNVLQ